MSLPSLSDATAEVRAAIDRYLPQLAQYEQPGMSPAELDQITQHVHPDRISDEVLEYLAGSRPMSFGDSFLDVDWMLREYDFSTFSHHWLPFVLEMDDFVVTVTRPDQVRRSPVIVMSPKGLQVCSPFPSLRTQLLAFIEALKAWDRLELDPTTGSNWSVFWGWWRFLVADPWIDPDEVAVWDERRAPILAIIDQEDESPLWPSGPIPWVSVVRGDGDVHDRRAWLDVLRPNLSDGLSPRGAERAQLEEKARANRARKDRLLAAPDAQVDSFRATLPAVAKDIAHETLRSIIIGFSPEVRAEVATAVAELESEDNQWIALMTYRADLATVLNNVQILKASEASARRAASKAQAPAVSDEAAD